jgi:hypothetical protein
MRKEPTCSFEMLEMQPALMYCHHPKTSSLFTITENFRASIIVQSVQNAALWVLIVVCVVALWTRYSETWILCSLNPHFPCDSAFFNQSYQNFHKNNVKSFIENNFVELPWAVSFELELTKKIRTFWYLWRMNWIMLLLVNEIILILLCFLF